MLLYTLKQLGCIYKSTSFNYFELTVVATAQFRGGRKGGPKTAKPHRNTPKNRKPHRIFSRIPKPRVHVGHNMKADVSKTCDFF